MHEVTRLNRHVDGEGGKVQHLLEQVKLTWIGTLFRGYVQASSHRDIARKTSF